VLALPKGRQAGRVALDVAARLLDVVDRVVDVLERAALEALGDVVGLALLDVGARGAQELEGVLEATAPLEAGVDRRVLADILAVVDRGLLDLADRGVDLADRLLLVPLGLAVVAARTLEVGARVAQVAQRVQDSRPMTIASAKLRGVRILVAP